MKISIVTLNYQKSHLTIACLNSVYEQFSVHFQKNEMEFIIVDNASPDDSVEQLHKHLTKHAYVNVSLVRNNHNAGFGSGCNLGAKHAKGRYLVFLNNDTRVEDKRLEEMISYMDNNTDIAIMGGKLVNADGTPQACVGSFYSAVKVLLLLAGMQRYGVVDKNPESITKVDWVKGGLMVVRKDVFSELGGFDEKIFMYTEDMEFCYRAKQRGFAVYFYPYIDVYHKEAGSSNRTFAIVNIYKNLLYFYKKHRTYPEYLFVKALLTAKAAMLIGVGKITKNRYFIQTYEQALKSI